jgi:RNA polymerase sigma-70 factor (ECF subfamily)
VSALDESLMHGGATDQTLIRRFRSGESEDAAMGLYLRYSQRLLRSTQRNMSSALSQRMDAEDVVQSVFRTFFRRASVGQYQVPTGDELWKLLLVISLNKVRAAGQHHRAAKRDAALSVSLSDQDSLSPRAQDDFARSLLELSISEVISELPGSAQRVVELRIQGHEVSEISEITARSKRTVERILQHFRSEMQRRAEEWS